MLDALDRYFPLDYAWSRPEGGMFIWAEGPLGTDIEALHQRALARQVAFVPGSCFYAHPGQGLTTMRLNLTMCEAPVLEQAIQTLSEVL